MSEHSIAGYRTISDMLIDETAYTHPEALSFDGQRRRYLLTIMPVFAKQTKEMCMPIYRRGPNPADFDVDIEGIGFQWKQERIPFENFPGNRDCIVGLDGVVKGFSVDEAHKGKLE
jgi:hypothetical protein